MQIDTNADAAFEPSSQAKPQGGPFGFYAPLLLRAGYSPVPIEPRSKRPLAVIGDWSRLRHTPLTEAEIAIIATEQPNAGLGVAGGYRGLIPIDIDTEDKEILGAINAALPEAIVAKSGRRGATAFFRAPYGQFRARKLRGRHGDMLLEVLTTGQTVIPPTLHSQTGQPYVWLSECTLFDVGIDELSELPPKFDERLEEALKPWIPPPPEYKRQEANDVVPPVCQRRMRAYAEAALGGERHALAGMPPKSGRNQSLFDAGCRLGKFVHQGILTLHELETALLGGACTSNGLISEDGVKACRATLASGLRKAEGDELPLLEDPAMSDEHSQRSKRIFELMDEGCTDAEVRAEIGGNDIDAEIAFTRSRWNGEARRMRAHAKTAERKETHTNVPTDGAALLDQVYKFLGRFVSYPSEYAHVAHTLWNAHAHAMDAWDSTPRLAFLSPEPGSGKTRALEVTEPLVPRPVEAVNVSPAYLFRKVGSEDGCPTILFDEIDTVFGPKAKDNEEIRGLINAGHRKGAVAGRCVVVGKQVKTEEIPAYCAVALAGLGNLPDTILTRSVVVRMRRRAPGEKVEPWRRRIHAREGEEIRDQLALWAEIVLGRVIDTWPEMPDGVTDRDADVWEALLAVADVAGGDWPQRARAAAVALVTQAKESSPSFGVRLLSDMRSVFGDADKMATDAILKKLHAIDEAPWGDMRGKPITDRGLARLLNGYEIKPKLVRIGGDVARGYAREDFHDAWKRYLPPLTADSVTTVTTVTNVARAGD